MFIGLTVCAIPLGAWRIAVKPFEREHQALESLEGKGVEIQYVPTGPGSFSGILDFVYFDCLTSVPSPSGRRLR